MRSSDNEGFFLLDALLCVFILSWVCILCFSIYHLIDAYDRGYEEYGDRSNITYESILAPLNHCKTCEVHEPD